jgi:cytochrome bd-type quinol oxidase subunit 1
VVAAAVGALLPVDAHACSVCWDLSSNDLSSRAMNWSILFLMAMPFTIVGSIGGWLVYKYRRHPSKVERQQPASGRPLPTTQLIQKESVR